MNIYRAMAAEYRNRFSYSLARRIEELVLRYPTVTSAFISWEGVEITGADDTLKMLAIYRGLNK